jgi:spore maturation protein CgeB
MRTYSDVVELVATIESMLAARSEREAITRRGHEMVANNYSKARQWSALQALVADLAAARSA